MGAEAKSLKALQWMLVDKTLVQRENLPIFAQTYNWYNRACSGSENVTVIPKSFNYQVRILLNLSRKTSTEARVLSSEILPHDQWVVGWSPCPVTLQEITFYNFELSYQLP